MTQVSKYPISKEIADRIFEIFSKAIVGIHEKSEVEEFLDNLLSPIERIMLAKRLAIALLLEKEYDHRQICKILRVSLSTVVSVNHARTYGGNGYSHVIHRILKEEKVDQIITKLGLSLVSLPAKATKGGGAWRYLKQEMEKKTKTKGF